MCHSDRPRDMTNYVRFLLLWSRKSWHLRKSVLSIALREKQCKASPKHCSTDRQRSTMFVQTVSVGEGVVLERTSGERDGEKNFSTEMMQLVRAVSRRRILARFPRDHSAINGHVRPTYDVKLEPQKQSTRQLKQSRTFAALPPQFNFFSFVSSEEKIVFCTKPHIQSFRNCWEARNRKETKPLLEFLQFFRFWSLSWLIFKWNKKIAGNKCLRGDSYSISPLS